jgi:hypothetical protein
MKLMSFIVLCFTFVGCSLNQTRYVPYEKTSYQVHQRVPVKQEIPKEYSGYIKGVVQNISYDSSRKVWVYEVLGSDISNAKLPYAKFVYNKKVFAKDDLIYAKILNNTLKEYFFTKKSRLKTYKTIPSKRPAIKHKSLKHKKKTKIGVPTSEDILLD